MSYELKSQNLKVKTHGKGSQNGKRWKAKGKRCKV